MNALPAARLPDASRALVWFKRDLRVRDHAPLVAAAGAGAAAGLYVIEPAGLASPECDAQHVAFALACLQPLRDELARLGLPLLVRVGAMPEVLASLRRDFAFTHLLSHEETGPGWTYARDLDVAAWCRTHRVEWLEWPQHGVVRRLRDRDGWAARWVQRMEQPVLPVPSGFRAAPGLVATPMPALRELKLPSSRPLPAAGEQAAAQTLRSFLGGRGRRYRVELSSPTTAQHACSRLSAHLAFGTISMRSVHQATEAQIGALLGLGDAEASSHAHHLRGFASRLRWHCHFMQKLEDEPAIEFRPFARSAEGLREDAFDRQRFDAWREGRTGFPMVDACMRSLNATGWLNFRMRAMLVSVAAYHLWLHWREPGLHLARQFLDFEAGIHWSQMQMQSGTTGINTLRIYSPSRQAAEHDPDGAFVRRWVPEWGTPAYPPPIVDERTAMAQARQRMFGWRATDAARAEADAIQARHGSRCSGLPPTGRRTRRRTPPSDPGAPVQGSLF